MLNKNGVVFLLLIFCFENAVAQQLDWVRTIGGIDYDETRSIAVDVNNDVYLCGRFIDTIDLDPGPGIQYTSGPVGFFIQRLDPSGNFVWARYINTNIYGPIRCVVSGNNLIIAGVFDNSTDFDPGPGTATLTSNGSFDAFILCLSTAGNFTWVKQVGGLYQESVFDLELTQQNDLLLAGSFPDTVDFDPGPGVFNLSVTDYVDAYVLKLDINGNFIWAKQMGGLDAQCSFSILSDLSGNVYTAGTFRNTTDFDPGPGVYNLTAQANNDMFLQKLDPAGNFIWVKQMTSSANIIPADMTLDSHNNVLITGEFDGAADFDPGTAIDMHYGAGYFDIFIEKLDSNGNYSWTKQISAASYERPCAVISDPQDNVYSTGQFNYTVDFDPGPGQCILSCPGSNAYISKLDSSGNFISAVPIGGIHSASYGFDIYLNNSTELYVSGMFSDTCDFDFSAGVFNVLSNGYFDAFIAKYDLTTGIKENYGTNNWVVFPNPCTKEINIQAVSNSIPIVEIAILDCTGKRVLLQKENFSRDKQHLNVSSLADGIYFLEISTKEKKAYKKIIKQ